MRQLTYLGDGQLEWRDAPAPEAGPDDVIVRPVAVARCDLDPMMIELDLFPGPYAVGHEFVGDIVSVGDAVTDWSVGDRVISPFQVSCGGCVPCASHRFAACATHRAPAGAAFGFGPAGGGHGGAMADLLRVPHADHLLHAAPTGVPLAALASVTDNVADAYRTVAEPLESQRGAEVLIVGGAGSSIGYYAILWASLLGASRVRYADTDPARCAVAESLGADVVLADGGWPRRFERAPITVAYTIDLAGLHAAIRSTDDYGHCSVPAIQFAPDVVLPLLEMYTKGITLHLSRVDARRLLPTMLEHVGSGAFDPLRIPTEIADWDDAPDAWRRPDAKVVVVNDG